MIVVIPLQRFLTLPVMALQWVNPSCENANLKVIQVIYRSPIMAIIKSISIGLIKLIPSSNTDNRSKMTFLHKFQSCNRDLILQDKRNLTRLDIYKPNNIISLSQPAAITH